MASGARPNSNVVRASVLETALELGIAHNSTFANWMFNTSLPEEPEEPEDIPPETEAEEVRAHYLRYDVTLNTSLVHTAAFTPTDVDACSHFRLKYCE